MGWRAELLVRIDRLVVIAAGGGYAGKAARRGRNRGTGELNSRCFVKGAAISGDWRAVIAPGGSFAAWAQASTASASLDALDISCSSRA
jgi:hypothetical protein